MLCAFRASVSLRLRQSRTRVGGLTSGVSWGDSARGVHKQGAPAQPFLQVRVVQDRAVDVVRALQADALTRRRRRRGREGGGGVGEWNSMVLRYSLPYCVERHNIFASRRIGAPVVRDAVADRVGVVLTLRGAPGRLATAPPAAELVVGASLGVYA